jgi:GNAT superfamily N-acetyltransferase
VLRAATTADVPALPAIELAAGERFRTVDLDAIADDDPPSEEELRHHVGQGTAWVATVDSAVVGYAIASVVDHEGHLDQVSLLPDHSGAGIGRALVERVCRWAAEAGFEAVTLTTFRDVPWNAALYRRLGFVEIATQELPDWLREIREAEDSGELARWPRVAMACAPAVLVPAAQSAPAPR